MTDRTGTEYLNPPGLPSAPNYSQLVRHGDTVYLAGQVSVASDGTVVGAGDAAAQTAQIYENIATALASVGGTVNDLVRTCTYVVGRSNLELVRSVRRSMLTDGRITRVPASTLVFVEGLYEPELLVEVDGIAVLGQDGG